MGEEASARIGAPGQSPFEDAVRAFNEYFYDEQGFSGNRERYDDPRNSFLNEVLNRRTGIPISLAVVYLEVARRAGLRVAGVNFPGHFLLRAPLTPARAALGAAGTHDEVLIVDPFHKGAFLSEIDCRELLRQHVGDAAAFDRTLLEPATRHQIVVRMLVNLKRLYVRMRSFPQARFISGLLLLGRPVRDRRAPRPRPARLSPAGLRRRAARSRGLPAAAPTTHRGQRGRRIPSTAIRTTTHPVMRASTRRSGSTSRRCASESRASTEITDARRRPQSSAIPHTAVSSAFISSTTD